MSTIIRDIFLKVYEPLEIYADKYQVQKYDGYVCYKWIDNKFLEAEEIFSDIGGLNDFKSFGWESSKFKSGKYFENTGYIRSKYLFISNAYHTSLDSEKEYRYALESFKITENSKIPPSTVVELSSYRNSLSTQLKRQAKGIFVINQEIASILKVYLNEYLMLETDETQRSIIILLTDAVIKGDIKLGSYSKDIDLGWVYRQNYGENFTHLAITVEKAIQKLTTQRDSLIDIAVKIAKLIDPVETIIEKAILGNKLLSPKEYRYSNMPDPLKVAKKMIVNAKHSNYTYTTVGDAMAITQEYIVENELTSIYKKVSEIERLIRSKNIKGVLETTDKKTIKNWIKHYAEAAGVEHC